MKYEYIYFIMCIEGPEFSDCLSWSDRSLDEIIMRHEFLVKTGKYTTPDPKRPQFKMENPLLYKILDTNDKEFATQIAGVTKEEWLVYQRLHEKLKELEDKERPYERIKPAMRKAYERRPKEQREKKEGEISDDPNNW